LAQRIADGEFRKRRTSDGAVFVEGPKACGKTETAVIAASTVLILIDLR
jgi:hypothetical protein